MSKPKKFPPDYPPTWSPRFWRLVDRPMLTESTPDDRPCWDWLGGMDTDGYGVFDMLGHSRSAHKVAYELKVGPVEQGMVLLHSCDRPPCCNYHHLSQGSQQANMEDMVEKGRHGNRYVSPVADAQIPMDEEMAEAIVKAHETRMEPKAKPSKKKPASPPHKFSSKDYVAPEPGYNIEVDRVCPYCGDLVPGVAEHLKTCVWAEDARQEALYSGELEKTIPGGKD